MKLVIILFLICISNQVFSQEFCPNSRLLEDEIVRINKEIDMHGNLVIKLERQKLLEAMKPYYFFGDFTDKPERNRLKICLKNGFIPLEFTLKYNSLSNLNIPDRIEVGYFSIIRGSNYVDYIKDNIKRVCKNNRICTEHFNGKLPSLKNVYFPVSVKTRIHEIKIAGNCMAPPCHRDALMIEFLVTNNNKEDLAYYFSVGYKFQNVLEKINRQLNNRNDRWIFLSEILSGWVVAKESTFPHGDDNEVCHGPARQFFNPVLNNNSEYDSSTEATEILLATKYCLVNELVEPRFGDYLYNPGKHSARFIMRDPKSKRMISFAVQSLGNNPYRFYWTDEDMSSQPFARVPDVEFFYNNVFIWRRCVSDSR